MYDKLILYTRIFRLAFTHDLLEDRGVDDVTIDNILHFHHLKQVDSILTCVCTVIDDRGTPKCGKHIGDTRGYPLLCLFFSSDLILTPALIYYLTNARRHGIYMLIIQWTEYYASSDWSFPVIYYNKYG